MEGFSLQIDDLVEVARLSFETLFELYPKVMTSRLMIILMMMTIKIKTMITVPIIAMVVLQRVVIMMMTQYLITLTLTLTCARRCGLQRAPQTVYLTLQSCQFRPESKLVMHTNTPVQNSTNSEGIYTKNARSKIIFNSIGVFIEFNDEVVEVFFFIQ